MHAFTDGDGRNHDDEFGEAVFPVQFKDGLGVDIGFAGAGFHFHAELALLKRVRQRQNVALLDFPHIGEHGLVVDDQGVADAVGVLHHAVLIVVRHDGKGGPLFLLPDEQIGHGLDGIGLKVLMFEPEFHASAPYTSFNSMPRSRRM